MGEAWTGGQYSLIRATTGLLMAASGLRWGLGVPLGLLLVPLGLLLAVGWRARRVALAALAVCLAAIPAPPLQRGMLALALSLHALVPHAPYLSLAARGRSDPAGGWRVPHALAFALFSAAYFGHGLNVIDFARSLDGPVRVASIAYLAFALPAPTRDLAFWLILPTLPFQPLGLALLHLLAFDPAWIPPKATPGRSILFYDGHCGLCHRTVRLLLAEERGAEPLGFAALQGETFRRLVPDPGGLPDSVVLREPDGTLRVRSGAVIILLERLGGIWRGIGFALRGLPRPLRDALYNLVARLRHRLAAQPGETCPVIPPALRARFLE